MHRLHFIQTSALAAAAALLPGLSNARQLPGAVISVNGLLLASEMGKTLVHEHILVDFIGADKITAGRYDPEEVMRVAIPKLAKLKEAGCLTMMECTPAYLGRDVVLLKRLSDATGLNIITNTGYYGASREKYFPAHAFTESAAQIAARWISEFREGIDGTAVKPGFIKSGVDSFPLTPTQQKVVEAAAITHLSTGLPIGIHTGDGAAAMEELRILKEKGVRADAWIWIHAQNEKDHAFHVKAAAAGGWVEFDGVSAASSRQHIDFLVAMKKEGLLSQVLVSQDAGWYHVGEEKGGNYAEYGYIFSDFVPALLQSGFSQKDIEDLFVHNPAKAFAIRKR